MKQLRWMVSGLLAVAVIGDGVLTCWDWRVRSHAPERSREAVVRAGGSGGRGSSVSLFASGLAVDGTRVAVPDRGAPLLIRYASRTCGYCARDTVWPRLAEAMRLKGVSVAVLLPRAAEGFDPAALVPAQVPQVAFVSMEWMKRYRLTVTPTAMLFNRAGKLVWAQHGMLRPDSIASALRVLQEDAR